MYDKTYIDDSVLIAVSGVSDGSMSKGVSPDIRDTNRASFLGAHDITSDQSIVVHLTYETNDFLRYMTVDQSKAGDGFTKSPSFEVDALFTTDRNLALFLPIADCIAMVLFDPDQNVLGLSHLGRHNLLQSGAAESVNYMKHEFGSDPSHLLTWLSPAAGKQSYPLRDFNGRGLHEVALEQLVHAGVTSSNVKIDDRDTTTDESLFSHSEFLKGNRATDGRQAVVAMLK